MLDGSVMDRSGGVSAAHFGRANQDRPLPTITIK